MKKLLTLLCTLGLALSLGAPVFAAATTTPTSLNSITMNAKKKKHHTTKKHKTKKSKKHSKM